MPVRRPRRRPRDFPAPGLPELRLHGLDPEAAAALLAGAGVDQPAEVVGRLVDRTGGNPPALLELPGSLAPDQLAGRAPVDDVLPLTTRLERAFGEQARRLPEEARTLLLVAAAEPTGDPAVVLRAGARLGVEADALGLAEAAGLVRTADGRLRFRHPLVRSAAVAGTMEHPRLLWAGVAAFFLGETGTGNALYVRAVARARQEGAVGLLPRALEYLAPVELAGGRLGAATASAVEGLRLARETGNDTSACRHLTTLAHVAALRGDEEACQGHAAEALDRAAARGCPQPWPATPSACSSWGWAGRPRPWPGCSGCWPPPRAPAAPSSPSTPSPTWSRRPCAAASRAPPPAP